MQFAQPPNAGHLATDGVVTVHIMQFVNVCYPRRQRSSSARILRSPCHDVCGCVCQHDKTKIADRNGVKIGTGVVLDTLSKLVDFGFNRSRVKVRDRVTT